MQTKVGAVSIGRFVVVALSLLATALFGVGCSCDDETSGDVADAASDSATQGDGAAERDSAADSAKPDAARAADAQSDASDPQDAQLDATADAGGCDFGSATSAATATMESLFGERVPFAEDRDLPAGTYEITYVDGCFKYASSQGWTIHAFENGSTSWHLVGANAAPMNPQVLLPGTVGITPGVDAYADFEDCVAANRTVDPLRYEHAGGPLGIWLADTNYPDNVVGVDNRNPQWSLRALATCEELDAGGN